MKHFYHYAHLNKIDAQLGKVYKRGDRVGQVGKTGTKFAHLHFERAKQNPAEFGFTRYTQGMTREQVLARYENPNPFIDKVAEIPAKYTNFTGYDFMDWNPADSLFHPGVDINSGSGNQDLGQPVKFVENEKVIYIGNDKGWGLNIWSEIQEQIKLPSMHILVQNWGNNNVVSAYTFVSDFIREKTGGVVDIQWTFENYPDTIVPPIEQSSGAEQQWHPTWEWQKSLGVENHNFAQLIYHRYDKWGNKTFLSTANRAEGISQVYLGVKTTPDDWDKCNIAHELAHNIYGALGIPDRTHYFVKNVPPDLFWGQFQLLLNELQPYWGKFHLLTMSNSIFIHKKNTQEYSFILPAMSEDALKDKAKNLGLAITKPDGSIDFSKAQEVEY